MKKFPLCAMSAALVLSSIGCSNWSVAKPKSSVKTGLSENREQRMSAIVEDLRARGYSEERAKQAAARQVPLMATTYSESLSSILAGDAKRKKFDEDLARSESARQR